MNNILYDSVNTDSSPHKLVLWYLKHHREMPWRKTGNPYSIWVSETMLQQTRVETVIPYYESFMRSFPEVSDLANADLQVVLKHWQGLGYYSRARNLHKAAQQIAANYGGEIPTTVEEFRNLPGVGPYTTGAVFSIAFNQPVPAIDGNVLRVMARYLGIRDAIETSSCKRRIETVVQSWLAEDEPRHLTQALMELGATVCTPRNASCDTCPLAGECFARSHDCVNELPVRKPKAARKVHRIVAVWWEMDNQLWMEQRSEEGLLAGLWQLPAWDLGPSIDDSPPTLQHAVADRVADWLDQDHTSGDSGHVGAADNLGDEGGDTSGARGGKVREHQLPEFVQVATEKHVFSHLEWHVHVFRPIATSSYISPKPVQGRHLVPLNKLGELPLPRVYEKLLQTLTKSHGLRLV